MFYKVKFQESYSCSTRGVAVGEEVFAMFPLERSGTAIRGSLVEDARTAMTLLWIDGSLGDLRTSTDWGDPRGYTGIGTVRPPPTDSRGRVGQEVRNVDEIKL